jgi:hypothetical protein
MIDAKDEIANLIIDSNDLSSERKLELIKYQNDHHEGIAERMKEAGDKFMEVQRDRSHLSAVIAYLMFEITEPAKDEDPESLRISEEAVNYVAERHEKGESPLFDYAENDDKSATLNISWKGSDKKSDEVPSGDNVGDQENNDKPTDR